MMYMFFTGVCKLLTMIVCIYVNCVFFFTNRCLKLKWLNADSCVTDDITKAHENTRIQVEVSLALYTWFVSSYLTFLV